MKQLPPDRRRVFAGRTGRSSAGSPAGRERPLVPCLLGVLAAALATAVALPAEAAIYEASFGGRRPVAASYPPLEGRPTPPWYTVSGTWRPENGGLLAETAGEIRSASIDLGGADLRAEIWADASGATRGGTAGRRGEGGEATPLLALAAAGIGAGLVSQEAAFVELAGDPVRGGAHAPVDERAGARLDVPGAAEGPAGKERHVGKLEHPLRRGRFRLVVERTDGLVSVRTRRNRGLARRETFGRRATGGDPGVSIHVARGVVVYALRIRTLPGRARPEAVTSGDEALVAGEVARAGALYAEVLADESVLPRERAEAAWKFGLALKASSACRDLRGAVNAFDRAKDLDPEGPWGERARLELARMALATGRHEVALAFAYRLVANSAPGIEVWSELQELVPVAREKLVSGRRGGQATSGLMQMAQYLEWAGAPRARARWAWDEVALSYVQRGWYAEADAVRDRTERLLGSGGLLRRLFAPRRSEDAPSALPEPEAERLLRERRERRAKRAAE